MPECAACGRDISSDMMFCPYCGTKRVLDADGRPIEQVPERTVQIIPDISSTGWKEGHWTVIVTDKHLIFAAMRDSDIASVRSSGRPTGFAFLSRQGPTTGSGVTYALRYNDMDIDAIRKEDERNFVVRLDAVQSAVLSQEGENRYRVDLTIDGEHLVLDLPMQHDHRDALMNALPGKVRW